MIILIGDRNWEILIFYFHLSGSHLCFDAYEDYKFKMGVLGVCLEAWIRQREPPRLIKIYHSCSGSVWKTLALMMKTCSASSHILDI